MAEPISTVVLCQDCVMAVENGDTSGNSEGWQAAFDANANKDSDITIGHIHSDFNCVHPGEECEEDCDCERSELSHSECFLCNTTLGGYRHDYTLWQ